MGLARISHQLAPAAAQRRARTRGSAMVELVFIIPVLLMLFFALAEFGIILGRMQAITNAAREGARTAVLFRGVCVPADVQTEVVERVEDYAEPLGLDPADLTIAVAGQCGAAGTDSVVDVSTVYSFLVLGGFAESLSPSITLDARSTMRNEG